MTGPNESDTLLTRRIRSGEAEAWNELIARFEGRLTAFVESRVRSRAVAEDALAAGLDDIGGAAIMADIASMKHEIQNVRLFRS